MLTADPRIIGLSAGNAALYEGNSFSLVASIDAATPVNQVKFYLDSESDGVLTTGSGHDTLLGTVTSGSSNLWTLSGVTTGSAGAVGLGRHIVFAQATDSASTLSNVLAFPIEVLSSDPVLQPIDNDRIVAGRTFVTTAKADVPPPFAGGTMSYALAFVGDTNSTQPTGVSFDDDSGTLIWTPASGDISASPYHYQVTATYDDGSSQVQSTPRDFYLTVINVSSSAQYLTTASPSWSLSTYNNTSGPIFYDYRSSATQGLRSSISANISPANRGAAGTEPVVSQLTYDTADDLHPIIEADVPVGWLNSSYLSSSTELKVKVSVLSGTSTVAQSDDVFYTLAGVIPSGGQYFHLAVPVDATSLTTGRYKLSVSLTYLNGSGVSQGTDSFGSDEGWANDDLRIVDRSSSDVGAGWSIAGLNRLVVASDGVMLIAADGNVHWFTEDSGQYISEADTNLSLSVVTHSSTSFFRLTAPSGAYEEFGLTSGLPLVRVDSVGNETTFDYYASTDTSTGAKPNALKSITDPMLRTQTFTYDSSGMLTALVDFAGRTTALTYSSGLLQQISHPDSATQEFDYDSNGLLTSQSDALGATTHYEYDQLNRPTRTIFPDGRYEVFQGSDTSSVAARTIVAYSSGLPVYLGSSFSHPAPLIAWNLDSFGPNVASGTFMGAMGRMVDANGIARHFTTDVGGEVSSQTDPVFDDVTAPWEEGTSAFYLHDKATQLLTAVIAASQSGSALLSQTKYVYDSKFNQLSTLYSPIGASETWNYTPSSGTNVHNVLYSHTYYDGYVTATDYRTTSYEYYSNGLLETYIDPLLNETSYTYTDGTTSGIPAGLIETVTDPNGNVTRYDYYSAAESQSDWSSMAESGLLKQVTVAYGTTDAATTRYEYDQYGNVWKQIAPGDRITQFTYDVVGRPTQSQLRGFLTAQTAGPTTNYEYDEAGRLLQVTDPNDNRSLYLYNLSGNLAAQVAPDPQGDGLLPGPETVYFYSRNNQVEITVDPLARWTQYVYDQRGFLASVIAPDPSTGLLTSSSPQTNYTYDDAGQLVSVEDPLHNFTVYAYSAFGRLLTVKKLDNSGNSNTHRSDGIVAEYTYNNYGELATATTTIDGSTTSTSQYEFDKLGRIKKVYLPDPSTGDSSKSATDPIFYEYDYDDGGRLLSVTAPSKDGTAAGAVTQYEYDHRNRLVTTILPPDGSSSSPTTTYAYDNTNFLFATLTDPVGNQTTWNFNEFGQLSSEVAKGWNSTTSSLVTLGTRSYEYDPGGNLTEYTDRNNRVTRYSYDAVNRMTQEQWFANTTTTTVSRTLSYDYDWAGRLVGTSDPSADYDFSYDALNRSLSSAVTLTGLSSTVTLTGQYDDFGNRTQLTATIGSTADFLNQYTYDALNRLSSISQSQQSVTGANAVAEKQVGLIYNDAGQLAQINRFDHIVTTPADPFTSLYNSSTAPNGALSISTYGRDATGRLTSLETDLVDSVTPTVTQSWDYDYLNRVTQYFNSRDSAINSGVIDYDYDDIDQLTEEDPGTSQSYGYDVNGNRTNTGYVTAPGNRLTADGRYTYQYDNEGNLVQRYDTTTTRILSLTYDNRNRLVGIHEQLASDDTLDVTYDYDTFNRRVGRTKTITVDGGEGESDEVTTTSEKFVYDGDHVVLDFYKPDSGSYGLAHRYLYGPATDQILAQENVAPNGTAVSVTAAGRVYWLLTDNLGTVRDLVDADGNLVQHYRYDAFGNVLAGDTSLTRYLYTAREYDSTTGLQYNRNRWYDSRTGRWLSEDPLSYWAGDTNLYRYVGNRPTTFVDPTGLYNALGPVNGASEQGVPGAASTAGTSSAGAGSEAGPNNPLGDFPPQWWLDEEPHLREEKQDLWDRTWRLRIHGAEGQATSGGFPGGSPGAEPPSVSVSGGTEVESPSAGFPGGSPGSEPNSAGKSNKTPGSTDGAALGFYTGETLHMSLTYVAAEIGATFAEATEWGFHDIWTGGVGRPGRPNHWKLAHEKVTTGWKHSYEEMKKHWGEFFSW